MRSASALTGIVIGVMPFAYLFSVGISPTFTDPAVVFVR